MKRWNGYDILASVLAVAAILIAAYSAGLFAKSAQVKSRLPALEASGPNKPVAGGMVERDSQQPAAREDPNTSDGGSEPTTPQDGDANGPFDEAGESPTDPGRSVAKPNEVPAEQQRALQSQADAPPTGTEILSDTDAARERGGAGRPAVRERASRPSRTNRN